MSVGGERVAGVSQWGRVHVRSPVRLERLSAERDLCGAALTQAFKESSGRLLGAKSALVNVETYGTHNLRSEAAVCR